MNVEEPQERTISISGPMTDEDLQAIRNYLGNLGLRTEIVPMDFPRTDLPEIDKFVLDESSEFLDKVVVDGEEELLISQESFGRFLEHAALRGIKNPMYSAAKIFGNLAYFRPGHSREPIDPVELLETLHGIEIGHTLRLRITSFDRLCRYLNAINRTE